MNILEALKEIESGKIIRSQVGKEVNFYFQATLLPYDLKMIHRIDADCLEFDEKIANVHDLYELVDRDEDFKICLKYLKSDKYSIVTEKEMVQECEKIRQKNQEDEE